MPEASFIYGKLIRAENKDGMDYSDWRCGFLDQPGIILICESERRRPGKAFIYFYTNSEDKELLEDAQVIAYQPAYFHTSLGEISHDGNHIMIETDNSRYTFEKGDFGLSRCDKDFLKLCAGLEEWSI